jgi:50S ribosomal protein L16 3-hydroxylase
MKRAFLGGLTARQFLERHWHKKPLLVRAALPGFTGIIEPQQLFALATRDDVESRLVEHLNGKWKLKRGPFAARELRRRAGHPWTVLVQGLNLHLPQADALMRRVDFVPWARLDDLMASYAVDGGGVGPHFDSYDVFLIQGAGRRRWRIGAQRDLSLVEGAPLRILQRFVPTQEWVLEPGDMLYLPPHWAHDGVALGECLTYSIGFRAPSTQEVVTEFLGFLQERIELPGRYADPDLLPPRHRGEICGDVIARFERMIGALRWSRRDIEDFAGRYLSEPKPQVFFESPEPALSRKRFETAMRRHGLTLDARSQLLFRAGRFYMNGERSTADGATRAMLRRLADARALPPAQALPEAAADLLYDWYLCGYCRCGERGAA